MPTVHLLAFFRMAAATAVCVWAMSGVAGEFHETGGAAIQGFDVVAYHVDGRAVKGSGEITGEYKGSIFHFKSAAHRDQFLAAPEKYAPQYGGFCAFGAARGYKAVTSPEAFSIVDGKLYLNYDAKVQAMWLQDKPGYIRKADENWSTVAKTTKVLR